MAKPKTVEEYIKAAPKERQAKLREMRAILKKAAPKAWEAMKWGSPVFETTRILFAYAAFREYVNFMPTPAVIRAFKKDLAAYATGKATVKFPLEKPLPKSLITRMAKYRVKDLRENDAKWM